MHATMREHLACRRRDQRTRKAEDSVLHSDPEATYEATYPDLGTDPVDSEMFGLRDSMTALQAKQQVMLDEIRDQGYTIQHFHQVDVSIVQHLHGIANNTSSEGIDNEGEALKETKKPDTEQKRRAVPLTPDIRGLVELFMVLKALLEACGGGIFNPWRILSGGWNLLYNTPFCQKQIKHKDYDAVIKGSAEDTAATKAHSRVPGKNYTGRDKPLVLEQMALSVIFSVEENTWWMAGDKRIHVPAGSFVIFRGDYEHAGAKYTQFSTRLHAYFDHPGISTPLRFSNKWPFEKAIFYTGT